MPWKQLEQELARWQTYLAAHPDEPQAYVRRGMAHFQLGQIDAAIADFDQAETLAPEMRPRLWQRGLAYYYAEQFEQGVHQFDIDLTVNDRDVEETLWRFLCMARLHDVHFARREMIPVREDPRRILHAVYNLYIEQQSQAQLTQLAAREGPQAKFYASLYLGLLAEVSDQPDQAKHWIDQAVALRQESDYMWYLAVVHQQLRGWGDGGS